MNRRARQDLLLDQIVCVEVGVCFWRGLLLSMSVYVQWRPYVSVPQRAGLFQMTIAAAVAVARIRDAGDVGRGGRGGVCRAGRVGGRAVQVIERCVVVFRRGRSTHGIACVDGAVARRRGYVGSYLARLIEYRLAEQRRRVPAPVLLVARVGVACGRRGRRGQLRSG